jgi:hypothetical protein
MKYYETHYEDYTSAVEIYNIHPELTPIWRTFPKRIAQFENLIFFGPSGTGKYSQVLHLLKRYSPSELKYEKKIIATTEKQNYIYKISDIHYEIDMSLLGCNSKILWHEIFFQIVDIVSIKPEKIGIIVCKNFHLIHAELLEIFYSYMQQYNHTHTHIKIKFILVTEHISFLPKPIINISHIIRVKRPLKETYLQLAKIQQNNSFSFPPQPIQNMVAVAATTTTPTISFEKVFDEIEKEEVLNMKEFRSFALLEKTDDIPKDIFNIICDSIIQEIMEPEKIVFTRFRDTLYDILTYNLDMTECLWYILRHFIENDFIKDQEISSILKKTHPFLKYYNNNYRPIYHLESIMYTIINTIHKLKKEDG